MAGDIKKHIEFFSEVVGFPLVALFDMHGVPGGLHAFLRMNDYGYFSIVQLPRSTRSRSRSAQTHAGSGALPCAPGTLQHLAFRVDTSPTCWRCATASAATASTSSARSTTACASRSISPAPIR